MVLQTLMKLCVTEPDFLRKWTKNRVFYIYRKIWSYELSLNLFYIENLFFTLFLLKFHIWENSCSWNKGQNTRSQLYCRIFNWTISPKQIAGIASFGHVAIINAWSKLFWQSMVRNECGQSGYGALKGTSIWNKLLFCVLVQIQTS